MKNIVTLFVLVGLNFLFIEIMAQTPTSPKGIEFKSKADYAQYKDKVKEYVAWYIKTAPDQDTALRSDVARFLMKWITGSPEVSVDPGAVLYPLLADAHFKYNADLLLAFMGGISVYEINNPADQNEVNRQEAGLNALADMANNHKKTFAKSLIAKKIRAMDREERIKYINDCLKNRKDTK